MNEEKEFLRIVLVITFVAALVAVAGILSLGDKQIFVGGWECIEYGERPFVCPNRWKCVQYNATPAEEVCLKEAWVRNTK